MALIADEGWPAIYGNHEVILVKLSSPQPVDVFAERKRFADLWWTLDQLKPEYLAQLRQLPATREIVVGDAPPIRLWHGMPDNPFEGFTAEMSDGQVGRKLAGIVEPVVVSSHTHRPLARAIGSRWLFNPGSVGMAYNGDPRAHYLLLDFDGNRWQPTFRQVEYDRNVVHDAFEDMGLFEAYGPLGPLFWKTIESGDPWVSDFGIWVRDQAPVIRADLDRAVAIYLTIHGPGNWAFSPL